MKLFLVYSIIPSFSKIKFHYWILLFSLLIIFCEKNPNNNPKNITYKIIAHNHTNLSKYKPILLITNNLVSLYNVQYEKINFPQHLTHDELTYNINIFTPSPQENQTILLSQIQPADS